MLEMISDGFGRWNSAATNEGMLLLPYEHLRDLLTPPYHHDCIIIAFTQSYEFQNAIWNAPQMILHAPRR